MMHASMQYIEHLEMLPEIAKQIICGGGPARSIWNARKFKIALKFG